MKKIFCLLMMFVTAICVTGCFGSSYYIKENIPLGAFDIVVNKAYVSSGYELYVEVVVTNTKSKEKIFPLVNTYVKSSSGRTYTYSYNILDYADELLMYELLDKKYDINEVLGAKFYPKEKRSFTMKFKDYSYGTVESGSSICFKQGLFEKECYLSYNYTAKN